jgi:hypothetical protein
MDADRLEQAGGPARGDEHGNHLPGPSIWPVVVAGGMTALAFGVVTSLVISVIGVLLLAWGLAGWIGEMRRG